VHDTLIAVECQPGSFYLADTKTCVLCDLGWYQPKPGQLSCVPCSKNLTTYGRGAMYAIECCECTVQCAFAFMSLACLADEKGTTPPEIPEDYDGSKSPPPATLPFHYALCS
jgi:hypothetical protein